MLQACLYQPGGAFAPTDGCGDSHVKAKAFVTTNAPRLATALPKIFPAESGGYVTRFAPTSNGWLLRLV